MINENYLKILRESGVQLTDYQDREVALNKNDALDALRCLVKDECMVLLGGDVYLRNEEIFFPSYDNWYYQKDSKKSLIDMSNESIRMAIKYIEEYPNMDAWFVFVWD